MVLLPHDIIQHSPTSKFKTYIEGSGMSQFSFDYISLCGICAKYRKFYVAKMFTYAFSTGSILLKA